MIATVQPLPKVYRGRVCDICGAARTPRIMLTIDPTYEPGTLGWGWQSRVLCRSARACQQRAYDALTDEQKEARLANLPVYDPSGILPD